MNDKSDTPVKLTIIGYGNKEFTDRIDEISVQINPSTLTYSKGISYSGGENSGTSVPAKNFDAAKPTSLNFDFIFDETGVIPLQIPSDVPGKDTTPTTIIETVNLFEKVAYSIDNETHRPNYLIVNWGSFVFKGQLDSVNYEYSLFRQNGSPLRVKISTTIEGYMDPLTEARTVGRNSPDLTRRITIRAGESIPMWCMKIYGDATYCYDIAIVNGLSGFRNVEPGTELTFPPLQRDGRLAK